MQFLGDNGKYIFALIHCVLFGNPRIFNKLSNLTSNNITIKIIANGHILSD